MTYYTFEYIGSKMHLFVDEEEIQVKRLKNYILRYFSQNRYEDISLFINGIDEDKIYELDDNEIVDSETKIFLEISKEIEASNIVDRIKKIKNI